MRKLYTIILLLVLNFAFAQPVQTEADYNYDFIANVRTGQIPKTSNDYSSILASPVYETVQSMPVQNGMPGSSCYPLANRVEKHHVIATNVDTYYYYEVTSGHRRYSGYFDTTCNSVPYDYITFPNTTVCSSSISGVVKFCNTRTSCSGQVVDTLQTDTYWSYSGGYGFFTSYNTINPNLIISTRGESSGSNTATVTLYEYTNVCWLGLEKNETTFEIFPNPTDSNITISSQNLNLTNASINVYDVLGNLIINGGQLDSNNKTIDVSNVTSGIYLLLIKDENKNILYSKKIIKK